MKERTCVQVGHHKKIGEVIEEYQKQGWRLHTYQAQGTPTLVNHYLLLERGKTSRTGASAFPLSRLDRAISACASILSSRKADSWNPDAG